MKVELLPLAEQHLENIYDFYYNKSENAAISIYNDILDEIESEYATLFWTKS